jgi:hypothetical protein
MKLFSRVKKPFALAALVLTLVLSGAFFPSSRAGSTTLIVGCVRYSTWVTYYSDSTYAVEVGHRYIRCNGTGTLTGSSSPYQQSEIVDVCCPDPNGCVPC